MSRFLQSSNSVKKDTSKLSSSTLSAKSELEQKHKVNEFTVISSPVDLEKSAKRAEKRKQALVAKTEQIRHELEKELNLKIKAELTETLETDIKLRLEAEYQEKLEEAQAEWQKLKQETKQNINQETTVQPIKVIDFDMETKQIVEAILFAAEKPMTAKQVQKVYPEIERPDLQLIHDAIDSIIEDYVPRPIGLKKLSSGYRFQVKEGYSYWVSRIFEEKPPKYSRALLETVAIIAYRQPVTRGDIEDIRGVSVSSNIIRTLLDREWIRVIAHKEVPGRPALYGSTKQFLDYFNLSSLEQLPTLDEIKDLNFESEKEIKPNEVSHAHSEELHELQQVRQEDIEESVVEETIIREKTIEEQAIEETEREEQEIIELVLENRQ